VLHALEGEALEDDAPAVVVVVAAAVAAATIAGVGTPVEEGLLAGCDSPDAAAAEVVFGGPQSVPIRADVEDRVAAAAA